MINIRKSLLSIAAVASLVAVYSFGITSSSKFVPEGRIGYSRGKQIESSGFYWCSAVVLDSRDEAIYAHSKPSEETRTVEKVMNYAREHNIDLSDSFVVINAGTKDSLEKLSCGFSDKGIEIRLSNMDFCQEENNRNPRKVSYSPRGNLLKISRGFETKIYDLN